MTLAAYDDADLTTIIGQAIKSVTIGIAPHKGKRETGEYSRNVPIWLRNNRGLPADEVAQILSQQRPELGIETEDDLMQALNAGAWERANGRNEYRTEDYGMAADTSKSKTATTLDPEEAFTAVTDFAAVLETVDAAALATIRQAWQNSYLRCGHKALARYLLSGDIDKATKKFAVN